jgi:hypothetical protein
VESDSMLNEKIRELISNGDIDSGGTHKPAKNVLLTDFYITTKMSQTSDFHTTPKNILINVIANPLSKVIVGSFQIDCITSVDNE